MINLTIKKTDFIPWRTIRNNVHKIMFNKQDMTEEIRNDKGEPTGEKRDTDYCVVTMEIFYYKPSAYFVARLMMDNVAILDMTEANTILVNLTEDTKELLRRIMLHNIESYDVSDKVNEFSIQGQPMWLSKADRVGLQMRFQAEKSAGKSETTLWAGNGKSFTLNIDTAIQMLYALEQYASKCYDNTMAHVAAVNALEDKEAIMAYDYTAGYPEKLSF